MSNWIRFHEEIRQGKHRGAPRALRFVFLELCLEARPRRGVVELPMGMDLVGGVHDLLGGSRREVAAALELYTKGPGELPSIQIEGEKGALRLVIPSWEKWNPIDSSAERMRRLRHNRALSDAGDASRDVTDTASPLRHVTPLDQRREDQKRDPPLGPPEGGDPEQAGLPGIPSEPKRARSDRKKPATAIPADWKPNEGHYQRGSQLGLDRRKVDEEADRFRDHHAAKGSVFASWDAAFRTWIGNVSRFAAPQRGGPPTVQQPAKPGEFDWRNPGAYHRNGGA